MQFRTLAALALALALTAGCDKKESAQDILTETTPLDQITVPVNNYQLPTGDMLLLFQQEALHCYSQAGLTLSELDAQTAMFLEQPTSGQLAQLRSIWDSAHTRFNACEIFHQPIPLSFEADLGKTLRQIDSWPIQGGYIDYLPGYPFTGIINDGAGALSKDFLISQHLLTDPSDVSIGFHALEFLLWGEDLTRPAKDFAEAAVEISETGYDINPENRRRAYLQILVELLVQQTEQIAGRWKDNPNTLWSSLTQMNDLQKSAYLYSALASYLNYFNNHHFNPENGDDLYLLDESPYAGTGRDRILESFQTYASLFSQLLELQISQLDDQDSEQREQLIIMQDLLLELITLTGQLPDLSAETLKQWSAQTNKISLSGFKLLDHIHNLSDKLNLRLFYKNSAS